jgi:hypothetical protein
VFSCRAGAPSANTASPVGVSATACALAFVIAAKLQSP